MKRRAIKPIARWEELESMAQEYRIEVFFDEYAGDKHATSGEVTLKDGTVLDWSLSCQHRCAKRSKQRHIRFYRHGRPVPKALVADGRDIECAVLAVLYTIYPPEHADYWHELTEEERLTQANEAIAIYDSWHDPSESNFYPGSPGDPGNPAGYVKPVPVPA